MKNRKTGFIRIITFLVLTAMLVSLLPKSMSYAKEKKIAVPTIKVKAVKNSTAIKVTINKTKNADGYEVYYSGYSDVYEGYRADYDEILASSTANDGFGLIATIKKSGKKKRSITVRPMVGGTLKIKVRAYKNKKDSVTYGKFSSPVNVKLNNLEKGYMEEYDFSDLKTGDYFKFGSYEQDNDFTNGREPIEWQVLSKSDTELFIVSRYVLDCMPYNDENDYVTWSTCDLRNWLNTKFYDVAFNESEKDQIKTVHVENKDVDIYYRDANEEMRYATMWAGIDTYDNIFLLSKDEYENEEYGFLLIDDGTGYYRTCWCEPTAYSKAQGVCCEKNYGFYREEYYDNIDRCSWWTRSPGEAGITTKGSSVDYIFDPDGRIRTSGSEAHIVESSGIGSSRGVSAADHVNYDDFTGKFHDGYGVGVRPALVIDLMPENDFRKLKRGDNFTFGSFEQDNNPSNGVEDIEWIVLSKNDSEVFLLSKYALDYKPFNNANGYGWEDSTLRYWLNNDFYNNSFSESEKQAIKTMTINNNEKEDGYSYEEDTIDRIFLLSTVETMRLEYFIEIGDNGKARRDDIKLRCSPTKYAFGKGLTTSNTFKTEDGNESCWWWTRTMYVNDDDWNAPTIAIEVIPEEGSGIVGREQGMSLGVRPALVIDINKYTNEFD